MIISFQHRGLQRLYERGERRHIPPEFVEKGREMPMQNPPHPGLAVRYDCLEPLGLSVTAAAQQLGVSRQRLSSLVNGHSGITTDMAIRLDRVFGGGAAVWYQMQAAYDLAQAVNKAAGPYAA